MNFELVTINELSKDWGITRRKIRTLCTEGRIEGAKK